MDANTQLDQRQNESSSFITKYSNNLPELYVETKILRSYLDLSRLEHDMETSQEPHKPKVAFLIRSEAFQGKLLLNYYKLIFHGPRSAQRQSNNKMISYLLNYFLKYLQQMFIQSVYLKQFLQVKSMPPKLINYHLYTFC